jgi:CheY-like chemotaxis protein
MQNPPEAPPDARVPPPRRSAKALSKMRHDIRNPLNVILGSADLLAGTPLSTQQRRYVEMCRRSAESIVELLEEPAEPERDVARDRRQGLDASELAPLGVSAYLMKPFTRAELLGAMATATSPGVSLRILLVDDFPETSLLVRSYLRDTAHQVDVAADGQIAFQKFTSHAYDLVLMDLEMPVMGGRDAIEAIRRWETESGRAATSIVAVTAHALRQHPDVVWPDEEIRHLVPEFLENRRRDGKAILEWLAQSDFERIRTLGHQLKGVGRGYGFDAVSVMGGLIETAAREKDSARIRNIVGELAGYLDRVNVLPRADQREVESS